jgi:hypothetical protein
MPSALICGQEFGYLTIAEHNFFYMFDSLLRAAGDEDSGRVHSRGERVSGSDRSGQPGTARQGSVDGIDRADALAAGTGQIGPDTQIGPESGSAVPIPRDGLMPFRVTQCLFRSVVRPGNREVLREQPHLFGLVPEPLGEGVTGMVALVPVLRREQDALGMADLVDLRPTSDEITIITIGPHP